jgi:CxxC motif-containing protein (DUF1111 family)
VSTARHIIQFVNFLIKFGMLPLIALAVPVHSQSAFGVRSYGADQPPPYRALGSEEAAQVARGYALFKASWVASQGGGESHHVGLGPLYNASACNECHNEAGHGEGPRAAGIAPQALVIQLGAGAGHSAHGDPTYGAVLNTRAVEGVAAEGSVQIEYRRISGYYYPYGDQWSMRVPRYRIVGLTRGPLEQTTVISPRLAPALYGLGLLEAVSDADLLPDAQHAQRAGSISYHEFQGRSQLGRMGWQNATVSIRDQATRAFADEMGVTSSDRRHDDCTPREMDCQSSNTDPEVGDDLVADLLAFLETLAVPMAPSKAQDRSSGSSTFKDLGCSGCHRPHLTAHLASDGVIIFPYTDLQLHDLGQEMADETVGGVRVATRWRTAPLWGLGYRLQHESNPTFMHDGRAGSVEEAILWHYGEAGRSRFRFMSLGPNARNTLLRWLQTL